MRFFDPEILDPSVHCFARCYVCRNLIPIRRNDEDELDIAERKCPKCGAFLEEGEVALSFAYTLLHTRAITSSKKIAGFDLATVPYVFVVVLAWLIDLPIWFRSMNNVVYVFPIVLIVRWFYQNWYRIRFVDDEYKEALTEMKRSLALWIFANLLCWAILLL